MRRLLPLLFVLVGLACASEPEQEFTPGSFIEKLRILGLKAEPSDAYPGDQVLLSSLVVDPLAGARPLSFLWLICDPSTSGSSASPCAATDTTRGISGLFGPDGGGLPPGVHVFVIGDSNYYSVPDDLFDAFPPGSPQRTIGIDATVLLVAYTGLSPSDLQRDDVEKQIALKRVHVIPRGTPRNHNPSVEGVRLGGEPFPDGDTPTVTPGSTIQLSATAVEGSAEKFKRQLPDGTVLEDVEPMVFSWYTTAGSFDELQRQSARTQAGQDIAFHVPNVDETQGGVVDLYVVLRDSRGGMDWVHRKLRVE